MTISNASGQTTYWNNMEQSAGMAGDMLRMGNGKTPLLDKMGGLGTVGKLAKDWRFIMSNQYALASPAVQKTRTEAQAAAGAPTQVTYDKDQEYNVAQIFQYEVDVTYPAQSATSYLDGLAIGGPVQQPTDPLTFQLRANMEQMALDFDWHIINGTYSAGGSATTAFQMRGLTTAIDTNKINADDTGTYGADDVLSTLMIDNAMIALADTSKAPMQDMWILCTAAAKQKLTQLYGNTPYANPGNTVGGQTIETINTDFGPIKVMYEPNVVAGQMLIVDMAELAPVFLPVPGEGSVFFKPLAQVGAAVRGMLYGQLSYTYTAESHHARIYGFDTA